VTIVESNGQQELLRTIPMRTARRVAVQITDMPPFVVAPSAGQTRARRAIDLTIAIAALLIVALPMLVIMLVVKLTGDGAVFFTQDRAGASGTTFRIFKFRTMVADASATLHGDEAALRAFVENDFKLAGDDMRITTVGKFLRRTSLDELPQLINVLFGHMSIVGIRPLFPEQLAQRSEYDQTLYNFMRPGLTGRWQVAGRSNIRDQERIMLDREYVEDWSLFGDLRLMAKTPRALLIPDAAC
jgi:lipopolysaccharide/colanic/teichoic acid biosynthesis glycosyltransferase